MSLPHMQSSMNTHAEPAATHKYANISFLLCVHTHLYLTSDCHNVQWWMHWLDELSLYTTST
jgi:hypothetical protein